MYIITAYSNIELGSTGRLKDVHFTSAFYLNVSRPYEKAFKGGFSSNSPKSTWGLRFFF